MNNEKGLAIRDDMSLSQLGDVFVKSGFFSDTHQASQAIVKVLAGRELGFGPIASMTGIYVIQGRISLSANLLAAAIKRSGKYNFLVKQMTDDICEIEYHERIDGQWVTIGVSKFTAADAKRALTKNMDKFPRNMLYARAMSNGARWYCPDVFGGAVYTPEELGANVNEEGEIVDQTFFEDENNQEPPTIENEHDDGIVQKMSLETAEGVTGHDGTKYGDIETKKLAAMINSMQAVLDGKRENKAGYSDEEYQFRIDAAKTIIANRTETA